VAQAIPKADPEALHRNSTPTIRIIIPTAHHPADPEALP